MINPLFKISPNLMESIKVMIPLSVLFCLGLIHPKNIYAQVYETSSGHVEFDSSVPLHSFTGQSDHLTGQINLSDGTVDFYVDLTTIETGIAARDKDMRETLETDRYPFAEFFGSLESSFDSSAMEPQKVKVAGEFTVHGVSQNVEIDGTLKKTEDGLEVSAEWELNIRDYDIEPPGILFYRVSEVQTVRIETLLTPKMSMQ